MDADLERLAQAARLAYHGGDATHWRRVPEDERVRFRMAADAVRMLAGWEVSRPGHGIAVVAIQAAGGSNTNTVVTSGTPPSGGGQQQTRILLQCECGARTRAGEVTTLDGLNTAAKSMAHHDPREVAGRD
jgi:hypothetical protein